MARKEKLFGEKAYKRNSRDVIEERDAGYGRLGDYWHNHKVEMRWSNERGLFEDDRIFTLSISSKGQKMEVALSAQEFQRFLRWV